MINLDRYMDFLEKHKLTEGQFMLLYCLYLKRYDIIQRYKELFPTNATLPINVRSVLPEKDLDDLLERKYLTKKGKANSAANFFITKKFSNSFITNYEAADELLNAYPSFMERPGGGKISLTLMNNNDLIESYAKSINFSAAEHKEVIKDLKYAVSENLIHYGIEKFVTSKQWNKIRPLRLQSEKEENSGTTQTFN